MRNNLRVNEARQQHDEVICSWPALFLLLHGHKLADTTQLPGLHLGVVPSAQKQSGLIPGKRGRRGRGRDGWSVGVGGGLSLGEEGSGSLYLPGVKELLPPVFKDVLLPLQEAHTCARKRSFRNIRSLCAFTHRPTAR